MVDSLQVGDRENRDHVADQIRHPSHLDPDGVDPHDHHSHDQDPRNVDLCTCHDPKNRDHVADQIRHPGHRDPD